MHFKSRLLYILIYLLFINWLFLGYVSKTWSYLGEFSGFSEKGIVFSLLFSIIPGLILIRHEILTVSKVILFLLYYYTYVPMIVVMSYKISVINIHYLYYCVSLLFSFLLIIYLALKNSLSIFRLKKIKLSLRFEFIGLITLFGFLFLVYKYKSVMNFVSPFGEEVYTQRFIARDSNVRSPILDYLIMILSGALLPMLLSYGIFKRKNFYLLFSVLSYILLYSVASNKGYLFYIPMMYIMFALLRANDFIHSFLRLNSLMGLFIFLSSLFFQESLVYNVFMSVFSLRFIMISGVNAVNYIDFFSHHEHTYFSHINLVNKFTNGYPYGDNAIGQVIGDYYYGTTDANYNANFLLTDGVAGGGPIFVLITGIIAGVTLRLINSVTRKHDVRFAALPFSIIAVLLMNISLFTTLLSGGLLLVLVIFYFLKEV